MMIRGYKNLMDEWIRRVDEIRHLYNMWDIWDYTKPIPCNPNYLYKLEAYVCSIARVLKPYWIRGNMYDWATHIFRMTLKHHGQKK